MATGWNEWQEDVYIGREAWDEFVDALAERDTLLGSEESSAAAAELKRRAAASGYRMGGGAAEARPARTDA